MSPVAPHPAGPATSGIRRWRGSSRRQNPLCIQLAAFVRRRAAAQREAIRQKAAGLQAEDAKRQLQVTAPCTHTCCIIAAEACRPLHSWFSTDVERCCDPCRADCGSEHGCPRVEPDGGNLQAETIGLGSRPNRDAFTRQLTDPSLSRGGDQSSGAAASAGQTSPSRGGMPRQASQGSASQGRPAKGDDFQPDAWRPGV